MERERLRKAVKGVAGSVGIGLTTDDILRSQTNHAWAFPDPLTRDEIEQILGMTLREVMALLNPTPSE